MNFRNNRRNVDTKSQTLCSRRFVLYQRRHGPNSKCRMEQRIEFARMKRVAACFYITPTQKTLWQHICSKRFIHQVNDYSPCNSVLCWIYWNSAECAKLNFKKVVVDLFWFVGSVDTLVADCMPMRAFPVKFNYIRNWLWISRHLRWLCNKNLSRWLSILSRCLAQCMNIFALRCLVERKSNISVIQ